MQLLKTTLLRPFADPEEIPEAHAGTGRDGTAEASEPLPAAAMIEVTAAPDDAETPADPRDCWSLQRGTLAPLPLPLLPERMDPTGWPDAGRIAVVEHAAERLGADLTDKQWHLDNTGQNGSPGIDLNLRDVWKEYDGDGVKIGIWDDGIDYHHADLRAAYDASLHIRINGVIHDPRARTADSAHGTAVAGIIAADRDGDGVTGIAPGARIAGVDFLSSARIGSANFEWLKTFDVTNHSWGPSLGYGFDIRSERWVAEYLDGLYESSVEGRGGLGTINVFSAGNSRYTDRNTNDNGLTSLSHTIAVAAVSHDGMVSHYSTPGAGLLISGPSNGAGGWIWTTDRTGWPGYSSGSNQWLNGSADHTAYFSGTSAAAPMISGVVALMLEANPGLGWRDVQEILAYTARHAGTEIGGGTAGFERYAWSFNAAENWNGGGLHHSNDYGFGLVDAWAAVRLAENWTHVQTQENRHALVEATWSGFSYIANGSVKEVALEVVRESDVETIGIDLEFWGGRMADYTVTLVSPSGTTSTLSAPADGGIRETSWYFASKAFWGESAVGTWTVRIEDDKWNYYAGYLQTVQLTSLGGFHDTDDIHVFTDEFSDYAGKGFGHSKRIVDRNGGEDTLNLSAVSSASQIDLARETGSVDGVSITLGGRFERIVGGDGGDVFRGAGAAEELRGVRGNDLLVGRGGNDTLKGGIGKDTLKGGSGADTLHGGGGNDLLRGQGGADSVAGGAGRDRIFGDAGDDWLTDGGGIDRLKGGSGRDVFRLVDDGSTDRILDFRDGVDRIALGAGGMADLVIRDRPGDVVRIVHDGDRLFVEGRGLDAADFTAADFLFV